MIVTIVKKLRNLVSAENNHKQILKILKLGEIGSSVKL
jgi:ribosomal protein L30/L7E